MKRVTPLRPDNRNVTNPISRLSFCRLLCPVFALGVLPWGAHSAAAKQTNPVNPITQRRVLLIGDSLTVGPFGDKMEEFLVRTLGDENVFIAAVCGSSPEHWLEGETQYRSRCGYRFKLRGKTELGRHHNGAPPEQRSTRKIEELLRSIRPRAVIVQLGTNWFDRIEESPSEATLERLKRITEQFHGAVRANVPYANLIWITPPDSSRFHSVQGKVGRVIQQVAERQPRSFKVIDSSSMIKYVPGKSGGDGVHLAEPAAGEWFEKVKKKLQKLPV